MVFPKKDLILVEINHFPGQSVLLKIKENGPVNCFSRDFCFCVFRPPQKDCFFAVPWRGNFGRILTMQLEPPKTSAVLARAGLSNAWASCSRLGSGAVLALVGGLAISSDSEG